ncbi:TetR/AcrR family transcriptional regulator [Mycobacterium kyogaense]|uniref:TetR/AcrR family transcriptional regulator n=1 Tax=Mycobacterium kyogaense TaxID=2212479 RepID=UPI000DACCE3E|nr:TetR/AcrR family transcriptional regulator [Mycobacterium kyogaense]
MGRAHQQSNARPEPSTRDRLLEAVVEIAGLQGESAVTYRSVATRAGVTHGLVRHYFGSRGAMLDEAFTMAAQWDISETKLAVSDPQDFMRGLVGMLDEGSGRQLMQFDLILAAARNERLMSTARAVYERYFETASVTMESLGIPDDQNHWAALFFAMVDGITLQHFIFQDDERTEELLEKLRRLLGFVASTGKI